MSHAPDQDRRKSPWRHLLGLMPIVAGCSYFWVNTPLGRRLDEPSYVFTSVVVVHEWFVVALLLAVVVPSLALIALSIRRSRFVPTLPAAAAIAAAAAGLALLGVALHNGWTVEASTTGRNGATYAIVTRHPYVGMGITPTLLVRQTAAGSFTQSFDTLPRQDLTEHGVFRWPCRAALVPDEKGTLVASIDGVEMLRYTPLLK